ncbi:MAG: hypothetical protein CME64_07645 [Halobacteriovoraceae bacterium]|nr:hypothetical protein [Halobacteriovoraceae bacterium]
MTIFFSDWSSLLRIVVISVIGYVGLVVFLRISGPRTLSKMNSFDFVITIALGSTFAGGILQKAISLADVLLAFIMLIGLQYVVTAIASRNKKFNDAIKASPVVVFEDGRYIEENLRDAHVTKDEVDSAVRAAGFSELEFVKFVILETNGNLVAVKK